MLKNVNQPSPLVQPCPPRCSVPVSCDLPCPPPCSHCSASVNNSLPRSAQCPDLFTTYNPPYRALRPVRSPLCPLPFPAVRCVLHCLLLCLRLFVPCPALPYPTQPCLLALPCRALSCRVLPCPELHCTALPCPALPYPVPPSPMPFPALPCTALPCPALPCPSLLHTPFFPAFLLALALIIQPLLPFTVPSDLPLSCPPSYRLLRHYPALQLFLQHRSFCVAFHSCLACCVLHPTRRMPPP